MGLVTGFAPFELIKDNFIVSTDNSKLNIDMIFDYLHNQSYWAKGISFETFKRSVDNSVNFGLYENSKQIGYARTVTDCATFAYIADVFILPEHRGKGLSKWLVECILKFPGLQGLRRLMLLTRDAQGLYTQFGFKPFHAPERCLELWFPDVYKK